MYKCRWFVLCETVIHDSGTNNLTLVNTLTEIFSPAFPSLFPKFGFAALLEKHGEAGGALSLRFLRKMEGNDEVLLKVSNPSTPERAQFFVNFPAGIRMFAPGVIEFQIQAQEDGAEWYVVATQHVEVLKAKPPTATQANDPPAS